MMHFIGSSIGDAIDWMQDAQHTTRPLAETVLFSMLTDRKAGETEDGFVLLEDDADDREHRKSMAQHRPRFRFSAKRGPRIIVEKGNTSVGLKSRAENEDEDEDEEKDKSEQDHAMV